jgi:hypothetical protein
MGVILYADITYSSRIQKHLKLRANMPSASNTFSFKKKIAILYDKLEQQKFWPKVDKIQVVQVAKSKYQQ